MKIDYTDIKKLRHQSGAGMMDCKKALLHTLGDFEKAIEWLRTKGLAKASQKTDRLATEGLVGVVACPTKASLVEINCETDFVARNVRFQSFVRDVAQEVSRGSTNDDPLPSCEALLALPFQGETVEEKKNQLIGVVGENIAIRRFDTLFVPQGGVLACYAHNTVAQGLGRIGVVVALHVDPPLDLLNSNNADLETQQVIQKVGHVIAMHIAASIPLFVTRKDIPDPLVEKEKSIFNAQIQEKASPQSDTEKMLNKRMEKYFQDVVLEEQPFVMDTKKTVAGFLKEKSQEIGRSLCVSNFKRFSVGE